MRILLTGATSLTGAEVLKSLLQYPSVASIGLLLPPGVSSRGLEAYTGTLPPTVAAVTGDPELPRFGYSIGAWAQFAASFDVGIHCAQRETQDQNLERARRANVLPVENWIGLLEQNPRLRLHHLSTALTAGTRRGLYTEFDLECGQGFHDAYERSKYEAEVRLREARVGDRVTIHRPSHTLGAAAAGAAFELGGAYPLLAILAASSLLPGDGRARIDFVPADYVGAAVAALAVADATGVFHLACGWHASLAVKDAAAIAAKASGRRKGASLLPRIVAPALGRTFTTARNLLNQGPVFDTYMADRTLPALGVHRPAPESWLETAVRAAAARSWQLSVEAPSPAASAASNGDALVPHVIGSANGKQFQRVGDVNVAYRVVGDGEPVVFLHGLTGAHAWDGVVERIATGRRAIIVEPLGVGDSEGTRAADYDPSAQAALLRGLLSRLEISSAHIVGNDIGGVIAQFFAVRWPHCVRSLVLSNCDAHGAWPPPHASWVAKRASLMHLPIVARAAFGRMVHDRRLLTRARVERYRETVAGSPEKRMRLRQLIRSLTQTDVATMNHLLCNLQVPTMVVWGADNAYGSTSWARTLYDAIPGARRLEIIPFAGISCPEEKPELFARSVSEFLDGVNGGRSPQ